MSLIGNKPIKLAAGVTVAVEGRLVKVTGPKGMLSLETSPEVEIKQEDGQVLVSEVRETKQSSALHGTTRALLNNMVNGVTGGYERKLELVGVGYRAKMNGSDTLQLTVGFSHPVDFKLPVGITAEVIDNTSVILKGIDKHAIGQVAANIRKIRKPEPYKGKGIKYAEERVRRKQGKSGKV